MVEEVTQNNDINLSDIIKEQSQTIDTLVSQVSASGGSSSQPIYQTTPQKTSDKKPNYVLYIGIAVAGWFLFRRKK